MMILSPPKFSAAAALLCLGAGADNKTTEKLNALENAGGHPGSRGTTEAWTSLDIGSIDALECPTWQQIFHNPIPTIPSNKTKSITEEPQNDKATKANTCTNPDNSPNSEKETKQGPQNTQSTQTNVFWTIGERVVVTKGLDFPKEASLGTYQGQVPDKPGQHYLLPDRVGDMGGKRVEIPTSAILKKGDLCEARIKIHPIQGSKAWELKTIETEFRYLSKNDEKIMVRYGQGEIEAQRVGSLIPDWVPKNRHCVILPPGTPLLPSESFVATYQSYIDGANHALKPKGLDDAKIISDNWILRKGDKIFAAIFQNDGTQYVTKVEFQYVHETNGVMVRQPGINQDIWAFRIGRNKMEPDIEDGTLPEDPIPEEQKDWPLRMDEKFVKLGQHCPLQPVRLLYGTYKGPAEDDKHNVVIDRVGYRDGAPLKWLGKLSMDVILKKGDKIFAEFDEAGKKVVVETEYLGVNQTFHSIKVAYGKSEFKGMPIYKVPERIGKINEEGFKLPEGCH